MRKTHFAAFKLNSYCILIIAFFASIFFLSSCTVTSKNTNYFQNLKKDTTINTLVNNDFENLIQPGDKLAINASSLNPVEDAIFNQGGSEAAQGSSATGSGAFLVDPSGKILLHRIGIVQVAGLTRRQLSSKLQQQLSPFMKEAIVTVNFINHKITVFGAVGSPQVIPLTVEQMPVIDALVLSGGMTAGAKSDDIMIIRDDGDKKQVKHISLLNSSFLQSEWYYARPNDIIYVMTDKSEEDKKLKKENFRNSLSLVASGISLLFIILDRVIR